MTEMEKIEVANRASLALPSPPFKFPPPPTAAQVERLAQLERDLIECEIARARPSTLAMRILVLRAEMYG